MRATVDDKASKDEPFLKGQEFWLQDGHVLPFLRVQLNRNRPGMTDFLVRVAALGGGVKQPTVITIRGTKAFSSSETVAVFTKTLVAEFQARDDESFKWEKADAEYVSSMFEKMFKLFVSNPGLSVLGFDTDALR